MKLYVLIGDVLLRAALFLTGAADAESLDESVLLRLEALEQRPLALNRASRSRLLSEGILTPYQVASLEEYRHLYGDVLSMGHPFFPSHHPCHRSSGTRWYGRRQPF